MRETLILNLPEVNYEKEFATFVNWASYGDLFAYDEQPGRSRSSTDAERGRRQLSIAGDRRRWQDRNSSARAWNRLHLQAATSKLISSASRYDRPEYSVSSSGLFDDLPMLIDRDCRRAEDSSRTRRMNLSVRFSNTKHVKHVIARAIACSMLLVLPSCGIPNLRQAEPGPGLPASFNGATSSENSSQLGIEEFFNDPMLTRLIDQALAGNRELKILDEEVQIASNEILARQGAYLPFVTFGAGAGLDKPSRYTPQGAARETTRISPRQALSRSAAKFPGRPQPLLAAGHLEAAAECQGRGSAALPRRQ